MQRARDLPQLLGNLDVECLETELVDLGPTWTTALRPDHPLDPTESRG